MKAILEDFSPFLSLIPTFCIAFAGFRYLNARVEKVILISIAGAAILAVTGVSFYFFPDLTNLFPKSFFTGESVLIGVDRTDVLLEQGVILGRGGSSFWGHLLIMKSQK